MLCFWRILLKRVDKLVKVPTYCIVLLEMLKSYIQYSNVDDSQRVSGGRRRWRGLGRSPSGVWGWIPTPCVHDSGMIQGPSLLDRILLYFRGEWFNFWKKNEQIRKWWIRLWRKMDGDGFFGRLSSLNWNKWVEKSLTNWEMNLRRDLGQRPGKDQSRPGGRNTFFRQDKDWGLSLCS